MYVFTTIFPKIKLTISHIPPALHVMGYHAIISELKAYSYKVKVYFEVCPVAVVSI